MQEAKGFSVSAKLAALFFVMIAVLSTNSLASYLLFALAFIYLCAQRKSRYALRFLAAYLGLLLLMQIMRFYEIQLLILSDFHVFLFWWLMPIAMIAGDLITSPPGQISAFFSRHKAHTHLILGTLVVFRFFPTMHSEFRAILASMKNRGLLRASQVIRHPLNSFEYILVPMLLRMVQIADALAVSALSRGIETPVPRSAYYENKTGAKDYICMGISVASLALLPVWRML